MAEPEAVQQAPGRGAVDDNAARLQFDAQLVQRHFPGLRHPPSYKVGMRRQLA